MVDYKLPLNSLVAKINDYFQPSSDTIIKCSLITDLLTCDIQGFSEDDKHMLLEDVCVS